MSEELRQQLRQLVSLEMASDSAHDLAHLDRVWANAQAIAENEADTNARVLLAGSYLHDLINLPKDSPDRDKASVLSAEKALPYVEKLGYSKWETAGIIHAIEAHSHSAGITPKTIEARILRDADRLDALGAIGIARWFAVTGALCRPLYDPDDPFAERKAPDDSHYSLEHWHTKLGKLAASMTTVGGRKIALERQSFMEQFLSQLAKEIT